MKPTAVVNKITDAIQTALINSLRVYHLEKSKLARTAQIKKASDGLEVYLLDYWKFVEAGRRAGAKKVPISVLVDWIVAKRIPTGGKSVTSLAFAIQTNIHKFGIAKRPFIRQAAQKGGEDISKIINESFTVELLTVQWRK
jgi:hypothetical protein